MKKLMNYCINKLGYKVIRYATFEKLMNESAQLRFIFGYDGSVVADNRNVELNESSSIVNETIANACLMQGAEQPLESSLPTIKLGHIDERVVLPFDEIHGENAFSAGFFYERGVATLKEGNDDLAFAYFSRAIAINGCEPARDELKKMAAKYFEYVQMRMFGGASTSQSTITSISTSASASRKESIDREDLKRLLIRAREMDSSNSKIRECVDEILKENAEPDLTKKCFIFYDGERAQKIHMEAYKRALEFVTIGGVVGDVLEFGVLGGWSTRLLCEIMRDINNFSHIHLFDSFDGLPEYDSQVDRLSYEIGGRKIWADKMRFPESLLTQFGEPHEQHIRKKLGEIIRPERIFIHKGFYSETLKKNLALKASIVHIDCDLYQSTYEVLFGLLKMNVFQDGCVLLFDDWNCNRANPNYGERRAFQEFLSSQKRFTATNWYSYGYNGMAFILHDLTI